MAVRILRYLSLYIAYFYKNLREASSFKFDFWFGVASNFVQQSLMLAFLTVIFQNPITLNGWGYYECLFLFGFALISNGIAELFFNNIWALPGYYVHFANLDRVLTRPVPPLFAIIADGTNLHGFIFSIMGIIVCCIAGIELHLVLSAVQVLFALLLIACGAVIILSINTLAATTAFWFRETMSFMIVVSSAKDFLKYPLAIYSKSIQIICTWVIPYAFTCFYPASYLLQMEGSITFALITPIVTIILLTLSIRFFYFGLKHYASGG